jgi:hypothetical protein
MNELMARHAIDAAVMLLSPPGVFFGDQGLADELARLVNERTATSCDRRRSASPASPCCPSPTSSAR